MRALIEWLARLFEPVCFHEWEQVAVLKDREENPTAATTVYACKLCAETKKETFFAPESRNCPPHRWINIAVSNFMHADHRPGDLPIGHVYRQRCNKCGDVRMKTFIAADYVDRKRPKKAEKAEGEEK